MGYADYFDEADLLDTMSWMAFSDRNRIQKLAHLYIKGEKEIRRCHRNYEGPTAGTVKVIVKSLYVPPRGKLKSTVEDVLEEVIRQKRLRRERSDNPPFVWKTPRLRDRRNAVAKTRYTVWQTDYEGNKSKASPDCKAISCVAGVLLMVNGGGYREDPRIYMREKATGRVKVVVTTGETLKSTTQALSRLAPVKALRAAFEGSSVRLNFAAEGFDIDGVTYPWRNVKKVYSGPKRAHQTKQSIKEK
jgi:hypothetical protein